MSIQIIMKYLLLIALFLCISCSNTRSFRMGFSPWPYDATLEALDWVYTHLANEGDIISQHMEEGVPWPEAYSGASFSVSFQNEIQSRKDRFVSGQKVLLQINPLNNNRDSMALYRGDSINMSLPSPWNTYALDNPEVKTAFLNYAKRMKEFFNPDYMLIGVEINLLIRNNNNLWQQYVTLHRYVYTELKKVYPSLQLGVSVFCVPYFPEWSSSDNLQEQLNGLQDMTPYIDFLAFSVHPFMSGLLAESVPDDYFKRLFNLTTKPIAISESSYPAQVWQQISSPFLIFHGSQGKQNHFLSLMLDESQKRRALFVIWFCIRDYDALWNGLLGRDPASLTWRDTGLYDELGNERLGLSTWKSWFSRQYT